MNGDDPPPMFCVSVDSNEEEVVCFHTDLNVLIVKGLEAAVFRGDFGGIGLPDLTGGAVLPLA